VQETCENGLAINVEAKLIEGFSTDFRSFSANKDLDGCNWANALRF